MKSVHDYAPYKDEEVGALHHELNDAKKKIRKKDNEIKRLKKEIKKRDVSESSVNNSSDSSRDANVSSNASNDGKEKRNKVAKKKTERTEKRSEKPKEVAKERRTDTKKDSKPNVTGESYVATAYTAYCDTGCTGTTATGVDVSNTTLHKGRTVIAVDPSRIPLGSNVRVQAGGQTIEGIASDTGGDIQGNRIDVLVGSKSEAINFGRQNVKVEVLN